MLVFRRLKDKNKTKKCPKVSMSQDDCSFFFTSVIVVRNHLFGAKPQQSDLPIPFDKIFAALNLSATLSMPSSNPIVVGINRATVILRL